MTENKKQVAHALTLLWAVIVGPLSVGILAALIIAFFVITISAFMR